MAECYWSEEISDSFPRYNRNREKSSGQVNLFSIWTIRAMDRTSAKPQVNLSLLRSNSLKFQQLVAKLQLECGHESITTVTFLRQWRIPNGWWMRKWILKPFYNRLFLLVWDVLCAIDFKVCQMYYYEFKLTIIKTHNLTLISNLLLQ